jgi:hypothetical protein
VIFTMKYAAFCQEVAGRFIHHAPAVSDEERAEKLVAYQRFLKDYEATFGRPAPEHIWPRPEPAEADVRP